MKIGHKTFLDGDAQNLQMFYGCFMVISSHFFKKEKVQTVILRCLTGFIVNWFKSYDRKRKYFRFRCLAILQKVPNFCILHLVSTSKLPFEPPFAICLKNG